MFNTPCDEKMYNEFELFIKVANKTKYMQIIFRYLMFNTIFMYASFHSKITCNKFLCAQLKRNTI